MQEIVSSQLFGGFTPRGLLAFGWSHPVTHALGSAVAIVLATRAVAGESETGAIELLMSQPLSRGAYFAAHVVFALAAIASLSAAGVLGTVIGQGVFEIERFGPGPLLRLALAYSLLQGAVFGITLLLSAFGREGGRVASGGFSPVQRFGRLPTMPSSVWTTTCRAAVVNGIPQVRSRRGFGTTSP